jgi:high-affinity Fe2+/Pb2+ permease
MTWYPAEPQGRDPSIALKTYRKVSALVRWVVLVVIAGLALAAVIGIAVSSLFTAIEGGR